MHTFKNQLCPLLWEYADCIPPSGIRSLKKRCILLMTLPIHYTGSISWPQGSVESLLHCHYNQVNSDPNWFSSYEFVRRYGSFTRCKAQNHSDHSLQFLMKSVNPKLNILFATYTYIHNAKPIILVGLRICRLHPRLRSNTDISRYNTEY